MDVDEERIEYVARHTEILRLPKQSLSTFGVTNIYYYLVTEPAYAELTRDTNETVLREGRVIAQRPRVVTPYYLSRLEGFSLDARKYFEAFIKTHGPDTPGLFYTYKNEPGNLTIISDRWLTVVDRLNAEIDKRNEPLAAIIKGEDEFWDISLLKFIYEITRASVQDNMLQLGARGLLDIDSGGVPVDARGRINELFRRAARGEYEPRKLKRELDYWNLFAEYEDRFFAIFKKRS